MLAALAGPADAAEGYPDRAVEWIVPFGPGGGSDRWARILSSAAIDAFGQPWQVRNLGGEEGRRGWRHMLSRPADGYTLLQGSMTPAVAALRDPGSGLRPEDVKIVAFISSIKPHLVAPPDSGFDSWEALAARPASAPPPRIGGTPAVLLSAAAGLDRLGVAAAWQSYSGTGKAVRAMFAGQIDMAAVSTSTALSLVGKAVAVVNLGEHDNGPAIKERIGDAPWIGALGAAGSGVPRWVGVHPDTPDALADAISEGVGRVLADRSVAELMGKLGEEIRYLPREEAAQAYARLLRRSREVLHLLP